MDSSTRLPRRWTIFDAKPVQPPIAPDAGQQPPAEVAPTIPNAHGLRSGAAGGYPVQEGDSYRQLIAKTIASPEEFLGGVIDRYLLAVAAHELELYTDAMSLLDAALSAGLDDEYVSRAEQLRAICAVKAGIDR
jgi:hypothetical protein